MSYEIQARGGLYPEGCQVTTRTAAGALQRYRALRLACDTASVRTGEGRQVSVGQLLDLARDEWL